MNDFERFDLVYDVGETMLENGAEIKRVELTIRHLADSLDLTNFDSFVMINGIFMTARCQNDIVQAKVKDVPISPISLGRIDAINTLSREIAAKVITPEEFKHRFEAVKQKSYATLRAKIFAYAFGSASFCFIFGGSFWESVCALILGIVLALYILILVPKLHLSKITVNISSSMIASILACVFATYFPSLKLDSLIIGGVISLVPGVPIANGIRYLFNEDYTSGWAQMIDAIVVALCISVGVGIVLDVFHFFS